MIAIVIPEYSVFSWRQSGMALVRNILARCSPYWKWSVKWRPQMVWKGGKFKAYMTSVLQATAFMRRHALKYFAISSAKTVKTFFADAMVKYCRSCKLEQRLPKNGSKTEWVKKTQKINTKWLMHHINECHRLIYRVAYHHHYYSPRPDRFWGR